MSETRPPTLETELLEAVGHALAGDWERAHEIAQEHEDDARANWIHAICHRMEGDLANARYWYNRVGRPFRESVSTEGELIEIRDVLSASRTPRG